MRHLFRITVIAGLILLLLPNNMKAQQALLGERLGHRSDALMDMNRIGQLYSSTDLLSYDISYDFSDSASVSVVLEHKTGKYGMYDGLFWGMIDSSIEYTQGHQNYVVADHESKNIYVYDKVNYSKAIDVPLLDSMFNEIYLDDLILTRPGGVFKKLVIKYLPGQQYKQVDMVYDSTTYLLKNISYYYPAATYSQAYYNCQDTIDVLEVPASGVSMPGTITCSSLVKTYKNFIAEFPDHTKGATVRVLRTATWVDSVMSATTLFEWYMNEHLGVQYTAAAYTDWLVNGCSNKLTQLPWDETTFVRQDTLQNIWNRFVTKYPISLLTITETVSVPIFKGTTSKTLYTNDVYDGDHLNAMTWTDGPWYKKRTSNNFDLSILPKNATIQSANLNLYAVKPSWFIAPHFRLASASPFMQIQAVKGIFIPGKNTFDLCPENYSGISAVNLAPLSTNQVSTGNPSDFWSTQDYPNQNVTALVTAMYNNVQTTGINYPVQYKMNDETNSYKTFYFGGPEFATVSKRPVLNVSYSASRCDVFTAFVNRALGTYLSTNQVKELYKYSGKLDVNSNCTAAVAGLGCAEDPGTPITGVTTITFTKTDETLFDLNLFGESRFFYKVGDVFYPQDNYLNYTIVPVLDGN